MQEGNQCVDFLVKLGASSDFALTIHLSAPDGMSNLLLQIFLVSAFLFLFLSFIPCKKKKKKKAMLKCFLEYILGYSPQINLIKMLFFSTKKLYIFLPCY